MSKVWTNEKILMLKQNYPNKTAVEVAEMCGVTKRSVYNKSYELGLKKSPEFLTAMGNKLQQSGKTSQFKPGHTPANKGKKMPKEMKERIKHTFFKKGHKPHNTKKDGHISIRTDKRTGIKYKYIRLSENNWAEYHRHVWEKHNGKIHKGFNIVFKNGNSLDCRIENLESISDKELMQRNSINNYPEELVKSIRKLSKLKKQITKIK